MKTITNVVVNSESQDAIIEHYWVENRDEKGNIVWSDEKNCIAKCHGDPRIVTLYVKQGSVANVIDIRASSIKELYKKILEIEKLTSEEFID
jgi:hypothetical protein